jgi:hypothetical protein
MKSIAFGLMFAAAIIPSAALADSTATPIEQCSFPPDHKVIGADAITVVGCIKDAAWQAAMASQSRTMIGDVPTFAAGSSVTDEHGVVYECPAWFGMTRCSNVTGSEGYRSAMRSLVSGLVASYGSKEKAAAEYPVFAGWIASL